MAKLAKLPSSLAKSVRRGDLLTPLIYKAARRWWETVGRDEREEQLLQELIYQKQKRRVQGPNSRRDHLHPSSLCGCPRAQTFRFLDAPYDRRGTPEDDFRSLCRLEIGTSFHLLMQVILKWSGIMSESEVMFAHPSLWLEGSADGIVRVAVKPWVLEIKSMDTDMFRFLKEPKEDHFEQAQLYMYCLNIPRAIIIYWDKSKHFLKEFRITCDPMSIADIRRKAEKIVFGVRKNKVVPVPDGYKPSRMPCSFCEFWNMCWGEDSPKIRRFWADVGKNKHEVQRPVPVSSNRKHKRRAKRKAGRTTGRLGFNGSGKGGPVRSQVDARPFVAFSEASFRKNGRPNSE